MVEQVREFQRQRYTTEHLPAATPVNVAFARWFLGTFESMSVIMSEEKKGDLDKVTLKADTLGKYFPKSYTPQKMQEC